MKSDDASAVCLHQLFLGSGRDGDGIDEVAVVVVEDEDVFVATEGWCEERAGLIGVDVACCWDAVGVDRVRSLWGGHAGIVDEVWCGVGPFGGADILSLGGQVSFDGRRGYRRVSTEGLGVKAWDE